ncbi:MAG: glycosyltransferase family 4 protein, partial [Agrococcus casei]
MHILLVTHYFAPENSAPTRRWAAFAERFIDHGHQVTVIAPPPHYPQGRVKDGLKQQYKPGSSAIEEYGATVFRTKYLQHRADIVSRTSDHLVAAYDSLGVAKRAAKQFGPPEVVIAT